MERLTKRTDDGKVVYALLGPGTCVDPIDLLEVWGNRLAAYEDAMPVERVLELAQAEKDGRLMILPPNAPLTLKELREMDGEPVFVRLDNGYWGIVDCKESVIAMPGHGILPFAISRGLAYRRKPEEGAT